MKKARTWSLQAAFQPWKVNETESKQRKPAEYKVPRDPPPHSQEAGSKSDTSEMPLDSCRVYAFLKREKERSHASLNRRWCLNTYAESLLRAHAWLAMVISCGNQGPCPCTFGPCQWGCEVHGERIRFLKKLPSKVIYSSDPQIEIYTLCFASIDCGKILFSLNFVSEGSRK